MTAIAGTRVGTGYIDIEPDFSGFQEKVARKINQALAPAAKKAGRNVSKNLAQGADDGALNRLMAGWRKRFERFGDDAGKAIAAKVGKGATKARGDMFGLADAVREVEKRSKKTGVAARALEHDMFGISRAAKESGKSLFSARSQLRDWVSDSKRAEGGARRLGGRLRGLGYEFGTLARGIRTSSGGFSGFDGVMARVNRSSQFFRNILRTIKLPVLVSGLGLAAQALSAFAAGAIATTSALGPLAGALVVLPASALAAAQAFGVLKLATAGAGDALKAALQTEVSGGEQAVDVMRRQEDAAERVADAKRNLIDVQDQARKAQDDLREARESATRQLQDMRRAAEESGTSEKEGVLSLREARRELAQALRDPEASGLDVQGAELAVERARESLESTRADARRAREDYRDAQKGGIDQMPEVVAAEEAKAQAKGAVEDAERDLTAAIKDNTAAMEDQGSAATALQQKMAQLPPAAQKFVRTLISMKPRLDALRAAAASGFFPGAEKGLRGLMGNFNEVKGLVSQTAGAIGGLAEKAGRKLGSAPWGKDLTRLGKLNTRIIKRLGDAGLDLGDALRHVLVSAEPFLDWLSESTKEFSGWIKNEAEAGRKSGALADFFDRTRKTMELLGPILKGVGGGLLNVGEAARPLGDEILKALGGASEGWRKWTDSTKGQNRLKAYFTETKPAIFEMGRLIRDAGKAFFELGKQKGVATLLRLVRTELIPALRDGAGAITGWASDFIKQFGALRKEGVPTFDAFIQVLVDHAGRAGFAIAKALVNAFLNAGALGKLAVAGWFIHRLGGFQAFAKMGAEAGGRFGRKMVEKIVAWFAGTEAGAGLIGRVQDVSGPNGRLGKAARVGGARLGKVFGRSMAFGAIAGLVLFAPAIRDAIDKYIKDPVNAALGDVFGDKAKDALSFAQDLIDPANLGPVPTAIGKIFGFEPKDFIKGKIKALEGLVVPEPKTDKAEAKLHSYSKEVGRAADRARKVFKGPVDDLPGIAERSSKGIFRQTVPRLDALATQGGEKSHTFADRVGGSFQGLAGTVRGALGNIETNITGALKGLKFGNVPKFTLKKLVDSLPELPPLPGKQQGGMLRPALLATGGLASVVPGNSTGDRHTLSLNGRPVAKVESKEGIFVGNRSLMGALEHANAAVPRFQKGGLLGLRRGGLAEPHIAGPDGPLRELGQKAIGKVFEGAKTFLGKQGASGSIPNAGPLEQFNRIFPSHTLSNLAGKTRFSEALVERIMRWAGLPGRLFAQISHGESDHYPGIYGVDPGGSIGRGLLQITSGVGNDAMINRFGGPKAMFNPLVNALAGKEIYDSSGIGAWYGLKYVTGMMKGGLLPGFAQGGRVGNPFDPNIMRGGASSGPADLAGGQGFKPKTIGRIKSKAKQVAAAFTGYVWGGGHGEGTNVLANGLDCSGAVAKLVQQSGWSDFAVGVSSEYARRFHPGMGDLFTLWSNPEHTFAEIEGQMWGTNTSNGLGYHSHPTAGFTPTHPTLAPETVTGGGGPGASAPAPLPKKAPYKAKGGNTTKGGGTIAPASGDVPTAPLTFGPLPTTLKGVRKELALRRSELWQYQQAVRTAKSEDHGRLAKSLEANISKLRQRIRELRAQQLKLIVQGRIGRKGSLPKVEAAVDAARGTYEMLSERAEQIMALEPEEAKPAAEYIQGQEMPAWSQVFGALGGWRNSILGGEESAVTRLVNLQGQIDKIKALRKDHPKAWAKWRFKIPALEKAMGQVRTLFNPGPPPSGSLEESLTEVQGEGHTREKLSPLPGEPKPGAFGGMVWDTQLQIRELGIKLKQALESNSGDEGNSELKDLEALGDQEWRKRFLVSEGLYGTLKDFDVMRKWAYALLPKFHTGGTVPGGPWDEVPVLARGEERIRTPEQELALAHSVRDLHGGSPVVQIEQLIVYEDGTAVAKIAGEVSEVVVKRHLTGQSATGPRVPGGTRI